MKILKNEIDQSIYSVKDRKNKKNILKIIKNLEKRNRKNKEMIICSYIKKHKLYCTVPKKIYTDIYEDVYLEDLVEGVTLNTFFKKQIFFKQISDSIVNKLYKLSKIEVDRNLYKILNKSSDYNWYDYLNNNFNLYVEKIEQKEYLKIDDIIQIKKYWEKNREILKSLKKNSLIHNDLNGDNIIVSINKGKIECQFIDFEWVTIGDSLKELSKLLWVLNKDRTLKSIFYESYKKKFKEETHFELKLEIYWLYDMLNHISQEDYLLQFEGWDRYLEEEKRIIQNIIKGEKCDI